MNIFRRTAQPIPAAPPAGSPFAVACYMPLEAVDKEQLTAQWVQVLPIGAVMLRDSREGFEVSRHSVASLLYNFGNSTVDMAVDYDHGMFDGTNQKAAGWGEKLAAVVPVEWFEPLKAYLAAELALGRVELRGSDDRDEQGVYLFVRWNEEAALMIAAREYRYISPVIFFSFSGEAEYLWNVAITNVPAIEGMDALAASLLIPGGHGATLKDADSVAAPDAVAAAVHGEEAVIDERTAGDPAAGEPISPETPGDSPEKGDPDMGLVMKLAEALGLNAEAEDFADQAVAALASLREQINALTQDRDAKALELEALKVASAEAGAMVVAEAQAKVADAEAKAAQAEEAAEALRQQVRAFTVDRAIGKGHLAPAARQWALDHYDAFEALAPALKTSPQGPPLGQLVNATNEPDTIGGEAEPRKALAAKARELAMAEHIPFTDALERVMADKKN